MAREMSATGRLNIELASGPFARAQFTTGGGIIADNPQSIARFHLITLRSALSLEAAGMRRRGASALSIVRKHYGIAARDAATAHVKFTALLLKHGIIAEPSVIERPMPEVK